MTTHNLKELIFKDIEEIPEDRLEQLQELIHQFSITIRKQYPLHPEVEKFVGILPSGTDAREEYYKHQLEKHK